MKPTTRKMSARHEDDLADILGGRRTKNSGATFRDQADGKHEHGSAAYVFAWDGKSTLGESLSITLKMWEKIADQAHWATPSIPLRWYRNEALTEVALDLMAVELSVFAEMMQAANKMAAIEQQGCLSGRHMWNEGLCLVCGERREVV